VAKKLEHLDLELDEKLSEERKDFKVTRRAKAYVLDDETILSMRWNGREIRNGK